MVHGHTAKLNYKEEMAPSDGEKKDIERKLLHDML